MSATGARQRRRVQVWFGSHAIADYSADTDLAERYATAMTRRFPGLRITNEPIPPADGKPMPPSPELPSEQGLWPLTVL